MSGYFDVLLDNLKAISCFGDHLRYFVLEMFNDSLLIDDSHLLTYRVLY